MPLEMNVLSISVGIPLCKRVSLLFETMAPHVENRWNLLLSSFTCAWIGTSEAVVGRRMRELNSKKKFTNDEC